MQKFQYNKQQVFVEHTLSCQSTGPIWKTSESICLVYAVVVICMNAQDSYSMSPKCILYVQLSDDARVLRADLCLCVFDQLWVVSMGSPR